VSPRAGDTSPGGLHYGCSVVETSVTPHQVLPSTAVTTCGTATQLALTGDGSYRLAVTAIDAAGNRSATAGAASYIYDGTAPGAPTVGLKPPTVSPDNVTGPQFTVHPPAGDSSPGGLHYRCVVTETSVTPNLVLASSAVSSCDTTTVLSLAAAGDGSYRLDVTAVDKAGNVSAGVGSAEYVLDTTAPGAPTVVLAAPVSSPGNDPRPQFTVTPPAGDASPGGLHYRCVVTETSVTPNLVLASSAVSRCDTTTVLSLAATGDGSYQLEVTAVDKAGNVSAGVGSADYTLDATKPLAPTVTLTSPASSPGNVATPQFSITAPVDDSPGGLTYRCSATMAASPTPVAVPAPDITSCGPSTAGLSLAGLGDGRYTLVVHSVDAAGNVSATAGFASYVYDGTAPGAPTVTLVSPSRSPGRVATPRFTVTPPAGDASPGGLHYRCVVTETSVTPHLVLPASAVTDCRAASVLSLPNDGSYQLAVTTVDKAGNSSTTAGTANYTLDATKPLAPTVTLSVPATSPGNVTTPQFSGFRHHELRPHHAAVAELNRRRRLHVECQSQGCGRQPQPGRYGQLSPGHDAA
jgi:hypothetical protein